MREITISDGRKINARGLKVAEIKDLEAQGLPVSRWGITLDPVNDPEGAGELFDVLLPLGTGNNMDLAELTPSDQEKLVLAIIAETYGSRDEEKNLSRSGDGTQTESE